MEVSIGHVVVPRGAATNSVVEPDTKRPRQESPHCSATPQPSSCASDVPQGVVTVPELSSHQLRVALRRYASERVEAEARTGSPAARTALTALQSLSAEEAAEWPAVVAPAASAPPGAASWETWSFCFVPGVVTAGGHGTTSASEPAATTTSPSAVSSPLSSAAVCACLAAIPLPRAVCVRPTPHHPRCASAVLTERVTVPVPSDLTPSPCSQQQPQSPSTPWLSAEERARPLLLVGAGGIGCELLKVLVLSGFTHIHLLDLDTIDATNLNRQFLFQLPDVGHSKADTARRVVVEWFKQKAEEPQGTPEHPVNPTAPAAPVQQQSEESRQEDEQCPSGASTHATPCAPEIAAYHDNIKASHFDDTFFRQFAVVLNALDNVSARQHVNRMCMRNNIPLIESGTMGYNGQVQPILKGVYECYDCRPKPPDTKTFAVCTIHARPTTMVHCVHYAKELYEVLFGSASAEKEDPKAEGEGEVPAVHATLAQLIRDDDGAEEADSGAESRLRSGDSSAQPQPSSTSAGGGELAYLREIVTAWRDEASRDAASSPPAAQLGARLLELLFVDKVEELLALKSSWPTQAPLPLSRSDIHAVLAAHQGTDCVASVQANGKGGRAPLSVDAVLSVPDCMELFLRAVEDCVSRPPGAPFRKDDDVSVYFVSATANLRARVFHIAEQPLEEVRSIAGSIVPAIATTNAIIAAAVVHELIALLKAPSVTAARPASQGHSLLSAEGSAAAADTEEAAHTPQVVYARKAPQSRRRRLPPVVGGHHFSPTLFLDLAAPPPAPEPQDRRDGAREETSAALARAALSVVGSRSLPSLSQLHTLQSHWQSLHPSSAFAIAQRAVSVTDGYVVHCTQPNPPNALHCVVCQDVHPEVAVRLHTAEMTLGDFVHDVLEAALGFDGPSVSHGATVLYEDEDYEALAEHALVQLLGLAGDARPAERRCVLTADALNKDVPWSVAVVLSCVPESEARDAPDGVLGGAGVPFTVSGVAEATQAEERAVRRRAEQERAEAESAPAENAQRHASLSGGAAEGRDGAAPADSSAAEVIVSDLDEVEEVEVADHVAAAAAVPGDGEEASDEVMVVD